MARVPTVSKSGRMEPCIRCGYPTRFRLGVASPEFPPQAMCQPCRRLPLNAGPHQRLKPYYGEGAS